MIGPPTAQERIAELEDRLAQLRLFAQRQMLNYRRYRGMLRGPKPGQTVGGESIAATWQEFRDLALTDPAARKEPSSHGYTQAMLQRRAQQQRRPQPVREAVQRARARGA